MKFRKKPVVIEATQWWPGLDVEGVTPSWYDRAPCKQCSVDLDVHGWVATLEGGHIVCPGDWIITGVQGERYPCKPAIFLETYDVVE